MADAKICLICGVDSNKAKKHERYNYAYSKKANEQSRKDKHSESDSDDSDAMVESTKKGSSSKQPAVSSRRTRNQNPKAFAVSMCKVMDLPDTPDEPFLRIFSSADYCQDCMSRVKEAHHAQQNLEKLQVQIYEAKVDFEIEMNQHLAKMPLVKAMKYQQGEEWSNSRKRYEKDLTLILEFNDDGQKGEPATSASGKVRGPPKRQQRQAATNSALKTKRRREAVKSEESEDGTNDSESEIETKKKKKSKYEKEDAEDSGTEKAKNDPEEPCSTSNRNDNNEVELAEADKNSNSEIGLKEEKKDVPIDPVQSESKVEETPTKDPNLKCTQCYISRYFDSAAILQDHIAKCHQISCDLCDKGFQTDKGLQNHKANEHGVGARYYVCGFCDKDFQLKRELEDHLDDHPEAKPRNCHQCGRTFRRKESLQKAFQIFKGKSVDPCQHCGKILGLKVYLEHNKNLKH